VTCLVRTEQVAYRYADDQQGLDAISMDVQAGEALLVTGPSGCGKSTLARCLTGLIPHLYRGRLAGDVWVDGLPTLETPLWELAEHAGMVFQNPAAQMLASTVEGEIVFGLENLGLSHEAIRERLESTLARFGLQALRDRVPQTLSGGEQQKLALAATMARQPPVLVLDEPLSMLDSAAVAHLVRDLGGLVDSGTTVVVCEHRPEHLETIPGLRRMHLEIPGSTSGPGSAPATEPLFACRTPPFRLEVRELTVSRGGKEILHGVDLMASSGEVIAVVGRNGVGKTTLLRTLIGLQPHLGTVMIDGDRPDLGMIFQNADLQLFNASVREEILYRVSDPDMALYSQLLEALGLSGYEDVPPLLLSEGEKRRVALATVLMRRPRHGILLDEPALGQDAAHKDMLMRLVHGLANAGQLVILTTHDLSLAAQADRLLLLGPQGWMADGSPAEVLNDSAPWAAVGLPVPSWVRPPAKRHSSTQGGGSH
jgi:energy-coupling factor transporter ATP-binding protein EcfA2